MPSKSGYLFLLIFLTILFTAGLVYASIELPVLINARLIKIFNFPGVDSSVEYLITEEFIESNHIRQIGFGCFTVIIILMIIGLAAEKCNLALIGAAAFFLPVFGHFALNMFFLAGLGILRVVWIPILDISYEWLNLGDIVHLPYMVIVYFPALIGIDIRPYIIQFFIISGIMIFLFSTMTWIHCQVQGKSKADWGLYRYCRHPQYLGWILWSYGIMLFIARMRGPRIMYSLGNSLPWLLSTMVIICVALLEEIKMRREPGYEAYCTRTPFFGPLPSFISQIISLPLRWILKNTFPVNGREVLVVFLLYTSILVLLSVPFVAFHWPPDLSWFRFPYNVPPFTN